MENGKLLGMHIYFSGIGGAGIAPLALIAKQAGFAVSGSDKQNTQYIDYLRKHGITDIHIGQTRAHIESVNNEKAINWLVYSSAVSIEQADSAELKFCRDHAIQATKRDAFLNYILEQKQLKLIAIAGTHGKTTTTALVIWLCRRLEIPMSYLLPAKTSFADMGSYTKGSKYFIYEADEFDRNFLAFEPYLSLISGVSWDHHEIFPTREEYRAAFREFVSQSNRTILWQEDADYLDFESPTNLLVQDADTPLINLLALKGRYNRLDAWLAIQAVHRLSKTPISKLMKLVNDFPGLQRRMEPIVPGLYSDYAHTPEKIRGAMSVALEMADEHKQAVVVVYEPLTNRRQHYMINDYTDCFSGADTVYIIPSYLAREDPDQRVIPPAELIARLADPSIAKPAEMNQKLKKTMQKHLADGDMVVCMGGGGGKSLDEWLRKEFLNKS
jgi:UDP-N-acetylmuramate--alanine ligase